MRNVLKGRTQGPEAAETQAEISCRVTGTQNESCLSCLASEDLGSGKGVACSTPGHKMISPGDY